MFDNGVPLQAIASNGSQHPVCINENERAGARVNEEAEKVVMIESYI